jgi:glutamate synthase (NADPH/NADH) small chain
VLGHEYEPIQIGLLQRHATDFVAAHGISVLKRPAEKSSFRIAIIGGGPAGLGCAAELAQLGHHAVIFEKESNAGGLNTRGVAYYKMKPRVSLDEVRLVESLGVEI